VIRELLKHFIITTVGALVLTPILFVVSVMILWRRAEEAYKAAEEIIEGRIGVARNALSH